MPSRSSKNNLPHSSNQYGAKKSPALMEKFLHELRQGMTPKEAALTCGISRPTAFSWKREDEAFRAAWIDAIDEGTDLLEKEARRRAVDGVDKPVYQGGELVGHVREYSDTLLVLMLKGRRREVYNTERHEHTGDGGGPINTKTDVTVRFVKASKRKGEEDDD